VDNSKKEDWQFRLNPSQVWRIVKYGSALLVKILTSSKEYFSLVPTGLEDTPQAEALEKALRYFLDKAKFIDAWRKATESGLLYGLGVLKMQIVASNDAMGRPVAELAVNAVSPRDVVFPEDDSFLVHTMRKTLPELRRQVEAGIYEKGKLTRIMNRDYSPEAKEEERLQKLGLTYQHNKYRPQIHLDEFWGDILNDKGEVVHQNQRVVVANEKYVLKMADNPYESKVRGFVFINPLRVLFRFLGAGIFDQVENHQDAMTVLLNTMCDSILYRIMPMMEADLNNLDDIEDLYTWEPGKVIPKKNGAPAVTPLAMPDIPAGGINLYNLIRQDTQNHTGVTDYLMGMPTMKGSPTATEVSTKTAQGNEFFEQIARDIENQGIVETIRQSADLLVQMLSMPIHNNAERLFEDVAPFLNILAGSPENRAEFYGGWDVSPKGISLFFEKREALNALMAFGGVVTKSPELMAWVKPDKFIQMLLDGLRIPGIDGLVKTQEEKNAESLVPPAPGMPGAGDPLPPDGSPIPGNIPPELVQLLNAQGMA
jgi:hypothetical protein